MSDLTFVPIAEGYADNREVMAALKAFTAARTTLEKLVQDAEGMVCVFGYRKNSAAAANTGKPLASAKASVPALPAGITPEMLMAALASLTNAKASNGKAKRK